MDHSGADGDPPLNDTDRTEADSAESGVGTDSRGREH